MGDGQDALQLGGRATIQRRKRVEREEQGGGRAGWSQEKGSPGWSRAGWSEGAVAEAEEAYTGDTEGKWYLKGFSTSRSPGGTTLVAGKYSVGVVESQVWLQGGAGTEVWLGVKLARSKGVI